MNVALEVAFQLVLGAGSLVVPLVLALRARSTGVRVWEDIAQRHGLVKSSTGTMTSFTGRIDGLNVDVRMGQVETGATRHVGTYVEVAGSISPKLELDGDGLPFGKLFRPEALQTGNLAEARACAVLDAATRRRASQLAKQLKVRVAGGVVGFAADRLRRSAAERALDAALELARLLSVEPGEVPARLLRNLEQEPLPEVKLHNHKLLLLCYPKTPEGTRALALARTEGDPELLLLRAALLPERPFETAQRIALSKDLGTPVRLKALALAAEQGDARLPQLLAGLIAERDGGLSRAAARWVRRGQAPAVLAALVARADDADAATARDLVAALLELGQPAAEPGLLRLLARHEDTLRSELVHALGRLGGVAAVEPLLAVEAAGFAEAREAITAIQSRLGNAEAGRLSVVKDSHAEGALSLVAPTEGALSLADEEPTS